MLPERMKRIEELISREMALILDQEIRDPRLGMVTVSHVRVARDLGVADIYVSRLGEDATADRQSLEALESARGYIRKLLAKRVVLKFLPDLRFHLDTTPRDAMALEETLRQLRQEGQIAEDPAEEDRHESEP